METTTRYFLTYSGRTLPLQLAEELAPDALRHRNTWFEAQYDSQGRMVNVAKMVYGEVELRHEYSYDAQGLLREARVTMGEDEPQYIDIE